MASTSIFRRLLSARCRDISAPPHPPRRSGSSSARGRELQNANRRRVAATRARNPESVVVRPPVTHPVPPLRRPARVEAVHGITDVGESSWSAPSVVAARRKKIPSIEVCSKYHHIPAGTMSRSRPVARRVASRARWENVLGRAVGVLISVSAPAPAPAPVPASASSVPGARRRLRSDRRVAASWNLRALRS